MSSFAYIFTLGHLQRYQDQIRKVGPSGATEVAIIVGIIFYSYLHLSLYSLLVLPEGEVVDFWNNRIH